MENPVLNLFKKIETNKKKTIDNSKQSMHSLNKAILPTTEDQEPNLTHSNNNLGIE